MLVTSLVCLMSLKYRDRNLKNTPSAASGLVAHLQAVSESVISPFVEPFE